MAKLGFVGWLMLIVGVISAIGLAGLFWNGTMLGVPILSWLPLMVHQGVAIALYITIVLAILKVFKVIK